MLSVSIYAMIKLSKTPSPQKLFDYDCVTLYHMNLKSLMTKQGRIVHRSGKLV